MSIAHVFGSAVVPQRIGPTLIVHCCNDIGAWGAGFVMALSKSWPEVEDAYRFWFSGSPRPSLGEVQFVAAEDGVTVANLIGQHGVRSRTNPRPVSYIAIRAGLKAVAARCRGRDVTVQMPKMGAGLAGGDWSVIEQIVVDELVDPAIPVTVYTFGAQ